MTEFEKLLKEYRKLVVQIEDEEGYLEHLRRELRQVETQLKAMAMPQRPTLASGDESSPEQLQIEVAGQDSIQTLHLEPPSTTEASALVQAVQAVAELGDGVTAQQLAERLNISADAARLRLQRAARDGLIARIALGRYRAIKRAPTEGKTSSFRRPDDTEDLEKTTAQDDRSTSPEPSDGFVAKVG